MYLNVAEMGEGVFGAEAAARKYFNKSAKNLTRIEAAMIAACLPNPKGYTVKPLSKHVASRYPWILNQMAHLEGDPDIQELIH
jgi:monofunctional biosynthetic peptidoglycan transglycosylase